MLFGLLEVALPSLSEAKRAFTTKPRVPGYFNKKSPHVHKLVTTRLCLQLSPDRKQYVPPVVAVGENNAPLFHARPVGRQDSVLTARLVVVSVVGTFAQVSATGHAGIQACSHREIYACWHHRRPPASCAGDI
jgi:hypothetical protein